MLITICSTRPQNARLFLKVLWFIKNNLVNSIARWTFFASSKQGTLDLYTNKDKYYMKNLLLILNCIFISTFIYANDADTLKVKYVFWSPPDFAINNSEFRPANNIFSFGFYKSEFESHFDLNAEEYKFLNRSENKLLIGNLLCAIPAGICIGMALSQKENKSTLLIVGGLLALGDIYLGISSYQDLKSAVSKRNKRIGTPTIGVKLKI